MVPSHCISEAQPGVEAVCALFQAAMASLDNEQYRELLTQQAVTFTNTLCLSNIYSIND